MANREINTNNHIVIEILEIKELLRNLPIIVLAGIFIGYLAPFGMDEVPTMVSIAYWVSACACGYFIYRPVIRIANYLLLEKISSHWLRVAIGAFIASILMSFAVPILTWLFFEMRVNYAQQFLIVLPKAIIIGGVLTFISFVRDYINEQNIELKESKLLSESHQQRSNEIKNQQLDKFIALLPADKQGELYCLEMSDHYLKVYTDKGHHLLLMRFKDALEYLVDYPGLQTHRSWWVAKNAVKSLEKEGRKTLLLLINDVQVPVSKTHLDAVKSAGFR